MIRIRIRATGSACGIAERASLIALAFLAVLSLAAAVEHVRLSGEPLATATRANLPQPAAAAVPVHPGPYPPPAAFARIADRPQSVPTAETKTLELAKSARIVPATRDRFSGEADRNLALPGTATVTGRRRNVPMLRDAALEVWGGEFASGDSRLKGIIQAGALTSVAKGAEVRVLELRGPLARVEIVGQNRTGWIRSASIVR